MYLNDLLFVNLFLSLGLTLTLDVFKYLLPIKIILVHGRLTLTLDVFKLDQYGIDLQDIKININIRCI